MGFQQESNGLLERTPATSIFIQLKKGNYKLQGVFSCSLAISCLPLRRGSGG